LAAAVGIVRVSRTGGREGESFASPGEQRSRIEAACERDGLELLTVHEELDVSGGTPIEQRSGLRGALEAVEDGRAQIIMVAYFDRLVRSLRVQAEVVSRVEAAGGRVLALDIGEVTEATAGQWLSGTMLGAVSEYYRRSVSERVRGAQARAVARGAMPSPQVVPGYRRREDGRLEPDGDADVIRGAFELRAGGATVKVVREYLAANGVRRSYAGTRDLLSSRVYLGEIHFGKLSNLEAHEPLVDVSTYGRPCSESKSHGAGWPSQSAYLHGSAYCVVVAAMARWPCRTQSVRHPFTDAPLCPTARSEWRSVRRSPSG
jgi:site-specific DNA recombinase